MRPSAFERSPAMLRRVATFSRRPIADVLIVPVWKEREKISFAAPIGKLGASLRRPMKSDEFSANLGETLQLFPPGQKEKRLVVLGLGRPEELDIESLRRAFAGVVRLFARKQISKINIAVPKTDTLSEKECLRAIVEGSLLADYQFDEYLTHKKRRQSLKSIGLIGASAGDMKDLEPVRGIVKGVYCARDLVNRNADEVNPQYLIDVAHALEEQYVSVQTTIFDKTRLEEEGMGLLLAVGRGSSHDPALIVCRYEGNPESKDHTVIIGKGITYDTGGLNLKSKMLTMKADMGGAATSLGVILAAAATKLHQNLTVVIPTAENAIGAGSYKPGDVYKGYSGKTVEIGNTDAEGRLVLADALSFVCKKLKPTRLIDFATLTGAIVVALGHEVSGLMCNSDELANQLCEAGERTYERVWLLPMIDECFDKMKSDIADLKNVGGREAASIKAALFLREFVADTPWAHLDIAGTAFHPEGRDYIPKHGTGIGVRLMMELLERGGVS